MEFSDGLTNGLASGLVGEPRAAEKRKRAEFTPDFTQERAQPCCCFELDAAGITAALV